MLRYGLVLKTAAFLILLAPVVAPLSGSARAADAKPTPIPIRKVVLFSSGVGYMEHFGRVRDNITTELRFKSAQINDMLKSLVLEDLDGGTVGTVIYPSQDPLAKTLKSFQVDISDNPPLAALLTRVRGAKVSITAQAEKIDGTILGVESRKVPAGDKGTVTVWMVNLISDGAIRAVRLDEIRSLRLLDKQLQSELDEALAALSQSRDQDKKPVSITFRGSGERRVRIGYVTETPIWKTTYRLVLADEGKSEGYLQGWAIVENQTDGDWNHVQLSLVSGRPISFVQDLYTPLYMPRPVIRPRLYASLSPQTYGAGIATRDEDDMETFAGRGGLVGGALADKRRVAGKAPAQAGQLRSEARQYFSSAPADEEQLGQALNIAQSVASAAGTAELGELFQYTVSDVTLPRQRSAMIPIVADDVKLERLSIYNASVLADHPLNGARLTNTSGKHLLGGPVTVFDGGGYAGDATIDNVPPDDHRLLSYAVDLKLLVKVEDRAQQATVESGKIVKGVLYVTRKWTATKDYVIENKSETDRRVLIEHRKRAGWKLVHTPKPIEDTDTLYRFEDTVPAHKTSKLSVTEENIRAETVALLSANSNALVRYSKTGEISRRVREALAKALRMKGELAELDRQIEAARRRVSDITKEQKRIRDNMKTVSTKSEYYNRLLSKLNDQETQIERIQTQIDTLLEQQRSKRRALESFLSTLTLE